MRRSRTLAQLQEDRLNRALALRREGRLDEAVILLESLLVDQPANPLALAHLAHCQLRRGQPQVALAELGKAEAAGGATSFTARVRGDALYRLARYGPARDAYREADALGDRTAWPLAQLARSCLRLRDIEGARGAAARAVEREPGAAAAWVVLGDVSARAGDVAGAEAAFARAHEIDAGDGYAYARLIESRLLQLEPEQRRREVELLLRSTGRDNRFLLQVLARLQGQLGDQAAAASAWRSSRQGGDNLYAQKMEGYALRRAGQLDQAAALMHACLLRDPEDVILFRTYVRMQRERGALDELRRALSELLPVAGSRRGAVMGELRKLGEGAPEPSPR